MHLIDDIKVSLVQAALADGSTDPTSTNVDMAADGGYDGVMFVGICGTITGSGTVTLAATQATTDTTGTALSGMTATATSSTKSDKLLIIDVYRPTKRYIGTTLTRATANSVYGGTLAIQYRSKSRAIAQATAMLAASVVKGETPSE